jgi:serine/threonine protein kinase
MLENAPSYFFDMELCDFNLDTFAKTLWEPAPYEKLLFDSGPATADNIELRIKQILHIMEQIGAGLQFIHRYKQVHRDLKPENSIAPP